MSSSSLPLQRHPNSQAPAGERSDGLCVCVCVFCPVFSFQNQFHCLLCKKGIVFWVAFLFLFFFFLIFFPPLFKVVVNKLMGQAGGEAGLKNYSWEKVSVIGFGSQNGFMLPDTKPSSMH